MVYGTRRFNAAFTRALQSVSEAETTHFLVLTPISLRSILILSTPLRPGLPKVLFPVDVPVKMLKVFLPSTILATCLCPSYIFKDTDCVRWIIQTMKFVIVEASPLPILIPLGPKIFGSGSCFLVPLACIPLLMLFVLYYPLTMKSRKQRKLHSLGHQNILYIDKEIKKFYKLEVESVENKFPKLLMS
jgi:hypothetical protein